MTVVFFEQAVPAFFVQHLDGADALFLHAHGRTQDGTGSETGLGVYFGGKIRVFSHITDHLANIIADAASHNSLFGGNPQAGNIHRSVTGDTDKLGVIVFKQEQGAGLGIKIGRDTGQRLVQGFHDIHGGREVAAHLGEQFHGIAVFLARARRCQIICGLQGHERNYARFRVRGKSWRETG